MTRVFTIAGIAALRPLIRQVARSAGLTEEASADLILAVQELMSNAVRHGGGWGRIRLLRDGDELVCVVSDHGPGLAGDLRRLGDLPDAWSVGGRGLALAHCLTDSLRATTSSAGLTVTVTMNVPRRLSPPAPDGSSR